MSNRQINQVLVRRMLDLYRQGLPPAEVEKHIDELKTGAQEETIRDLKSCFIMEKLSEKIEVEVQRRRRSTPRSPPSPSGRAGGSTASATSWPSEGGLISVYVRHPRREDRRSTDREGEGHRDHSPRTKAEGEKPAKKEKKAKAAPAAEPAAESPPIRPKSAKKRPRRSPPKKGADETADAT